jgi:hypothetical protein
MGLVLLAAGGCASPEPASGPEPMVSTMVIDQAMLDRNAAPTHAYFVNTTVMTDNDGVTLVPKRNLPGYEYYVLDTTTFIANVFLLPYQAWEIPPGKDVPNRAVTFPPSYTDARPATPF